MLKVTAACLFLIFAACLGAGLGGQTPPAAQSGQQPPQPPAITVQQIKANIYMVKGGSGANTGFYIGDKGVIAIDAKMTEESAKQIVAEIKKLTPKPIQYIVITHSDGDHVNGLNGFPQGLTIISHEQTKKDMEEAFKDSKYEALRVYLPNLIMTDHYEITIDTLPVQLKHFGPAHTSGDVVVYFPAEKVVFVGDLVFIGRDPLIHRQKGGTSFGLVKNLKEILKLEADTFIPGHGDIVSKKDIETLMTSIEEKQAKIKAMVQEGKSLDEIKKAFGVESPSPAQSQQGRMRWPSLVEVIYLDITEKK
jgi:glyoxylase-like metal-dependent hydrolase (beta-lactamase superfamily II)